MLATILLFVLLFICLFIFVFCKGCLCNHLSGVIIFLRTTEALSCRGLLQPYSREGGNSSFLSSKRCYFGAKRSILRGRLLILKKNLIQFIAVTNLTAVKIEERKEKSNSIHSQENVWQHRLISWVSSVFFGLLYAVVARLYKLYMPYDHEKAETNDTSLLPWFLLYMYLKN